jgi:hypothetical protein
MDGAGLKQLMTDVLKIEDLLGFATSYGVVEREGQLDIVGFLLSLVLNGGTHEGGRQVDVLRTYLEHVCPAKPRIARKGGPRHLAAARPEPFAFRATGGAVSSWMTSSTLGLRRQFGSSARLRSRPIVRFHSKTLVLGSASISAKRRYQTAMAFINWMA